MREKNGCRIFVEASRREKKNGKRLIAWWIFNDIFEPVAIDLWEKKRNFCSLFLDLIIFHFKEYSNFYLIEDYFQIEFLRGKSNKNLDKPDRLNSNYIFKKAIKKILKVTTLSKN